MPKRAPKLEQQANLPKVVEAKDHQPKDKCLSAEPSMEPVNPPTAATPPKNPPHTKPVTIQNIIQGTDRSL